MNLRNSEHYVDPTPYAALNGNNVRVGDVFTFKDSPTIIIARNDNVVSTLKLVRFTGENTSMCHVFDDYYTDVYYITYTFVDRLQDYMYTLTPSEMNAIRRKIADSFALNGALKSTTEAEPREMVDKPEHYDGTHCIELMQLLFGKSAVAAFCRCNIFKYRYRADRKNGAEDLKKADWYERYLSDLLGKE